MFDIAALVLSLSRARQMRQVPRRTESEGKQPVSNGVGAIAPPKNSATKEKASLPDRFEKREVAPASGQTV